MPRTSQAHAQPRFRFTEIGRMPRILGVDIPNDKRAVISLQYIYGIGPHLAVVLCQRTGIDPERRARDLSEDDLARLASLLDNEYTVEGQLRRQVQQNIA